MVKYKLATLLAKVKPSNIHRDVQTGLPVGKESW